MTAAGGKRMLLTAALLVAGIRLWMQLRGKTTTPFSEWAIGWGALFFLLSLFSEISPTGAGGMALTIVIGDVLVNGTSLITDVSSTITQAEKGGTPFVSQPFATMTPAAVAPKKRK